MPSYLGYWTMLQSLQPPDCKIVCYAQLARLADYAAIIKTS